MARKTPGDDLGQKRRRSKPKNKEPEETPPPLTAEEFEQAFKQYCSEKGAPAARRTSRRSSLILSCPISCVLLSVQALLYGGRHFKASDDLLFGAVSSLCRANLPAAGSCCTGHHH